MVVPKVELLLAMKLIVAPVISLASSYEGEEELLILAGMYERRGLVGVKVGLKKEKGERLVASEAGRVEGKGLTSREKEGIGGIKMIGVREKGGCEFLFSGFDRKVRIGRWEEGVSVMQEYGEHSGRVNSIDVREGRVMSAGEERKLVIRNLN